MEEILLIALIVGAGYCLLVHQSKAIVNQSPITHSQSTQTEIITKPTDDNKSLEKTLDTLIQNIKQLNRQIK